MFATLSGLEEIRRAGELVTYLALGNREQALDYLEKAGTESDRWLVWACTETKLDPLRDEPRFIEILRRTRNPLALR